MVPSPFGGSRSNASRSVHSRTSRSGTSRLSQADSESRILSALPLIGPEQLQAPVTDPIGENPNMAAGPDEDHQRFLSARTSTVKPG